MLHQQNIQQHKGHVFVDCGKMFKTNGSLNIIDLFIESKYTEMALSNFIERESMTRVGSI